jgi:hypothetical protein
MKNLILILMVTGLSFAAQAQNKEPKVYDYVTITAEGLQPEKAFLSFTKDDHTSLIKIDSKIKYDFTGLLQVVQEMESRGYELVTQSLNTLEEGEEEKVVNYFLMRKKKEEE